MNDQPYHTDTSSHPPALSFEERKDLLLKELDQIETSGGLHAYLIDKASLLPEFPKHVNKDDYQLISCQYSIWLYTENNNGTFIIHGDSNSKIIKGIFALCRQLLSGLPATLVKESDITFLDHLIFSRIFTSVRHNSILNLIDRIKTSALYMR